MSTKYAIKKKFSDYYIMPKQRQKRVKRKRRVVRKKPMQANGPVDRWFRKTFSKKNLRKANRFLKKNKVISRTASVLV